MLIEGVVSDGLQLEFIIVKFLLVFLKAFKYSQKSHYPILKCNNTHSLRNVHTGTNL